MNNKKFREYYKKLNAEQKEAVEQIEGPVMVIAGPGTGKTQILAMRIANILEKTQVNPGNILCLTFTNSGVLAMKKRLLEIIGAPSYQIHVHTFHSFCNEVISTYPEKFLIAKRLNQLTDLEQIIFIQEILDKNNFEQLKPFKSPYYFQSAILAMIKKLKQEDIRPEKFLLAVKKELENLESRSDLYHEKGKYKGQMKGQYKTEKSQLLKDLELAKIYEFYQKKLTDEGKYDYADMILFVVNAFKNDPEILSSYQERFQYILVDEYQDTNSAQNEVVTLLASFYDEPNIFVVGDDEQSIFRFQGASMENILLFSKTYPSAKIIVLKENYRSGQEILDASRALISQNQNQIASRLKIKKLLKSKVKGKSNIYVSSFSVGKVEDYFVAKKIEDEIKKGTQPSEIAVLYKEHRDVENLVEILAKLNIPYRLEIGGDILEDPEIGKIINFLKIVSGKFTEDLVIFEVMHYPFFAISPIDIYKIVRKANKQKKTILDILVEKDFEDLKLEKKKNLIKFAELIFSCRQKTYDKTFAESFEFIINATGFLNYLLKTKDSVHHLNRLQIFFDEIKNLNRRDKSLNVVGFLKYLDQLKENNLIIKEKELDVDFDGVNLMTAHKSKGLEFKIVFILHLTSGHWDGKIKHELIKIPEGLLQIQNKTDNLEEERRLFYVSLTRAKKDIYLTSAENYGDIENSSINIPSQFLEELPEKYLIDINSKPYEKEYEKRLKLTFGEKKWQKSRKLKDFVKRIVADFSLSATSFNSYLNCPEEFYYDHIIRVPKVKNFTQSYGTAVHKALELLFLKQIKDRKLPSKKDFVSYFVEGLENEILTDEEYERMRKSGTKALESYYDFYKTEFLKKGPPISCEYNFGNHNVHFGSIPITGKIDKIELLSRTSNQVKITDYKTSKPKSLNDILGKNRNADKSLLYQAYFYKLLSEMDPLFRWEIKEIEFDFVQPDSDKFKKVIVPIEAGEYQEFKKLLEEIYGNILNLKFSGSSKICQKRKTECLYQNICTT